jgi:hypothetical protein
MEAFPDSTLPANPDLSGNQRKDARQLGQAVEELDAGRLEFKLAARSR